MDFLTAVIGLLLLLHSVEGQTTAVSMITTASSTTSPSTEIASTSPTFTNPSNSRKCSTYPPLCCAGQNNTCNRGCYCDVACLRFRDCCPDFSTTCVAVSTSTSTTPIPDGQNGTSINTTASPVSNVTSTPSFPLNTYSGKCSEPKLCCMGSNLSCFRGCFCDEACVQYNDCCPDYTNICKEDGQNGTSINTTASPVSNVTSTPSFPSNMYSDIKTVIGELRVSLLTTAGTSDQTVEASLHIATVRLQGYLKNISSAIESVRIIRFIKT
ncbi:hypothetical protein MATL_G00034520 [Megalops atlanticus]|uniref:SMB domain-containing protein n=1 Tax=Megalops atlanticus TaxID=7932 RepID=A0A9D3TK79_MEGAT|nr:hypothetical protein MATL_G00034520 [Megalops atlanticus]